jgi:hypothetical protein
MERRFIDASPWRHSGARESAIGNPFQDAVDIFWIPGPAQMRRPGMTR